MNKNELYTVEITDLSHEGAGIGHQDGVAIFVAGAIPGDVVEALIIKAKKNYCIGKLMRILTPSKDRTEPKCPIASRCGGCSIMNVDYKCQLKMKQDMVSENLIRLGGIDREYLCSITEPIIGMDEPYHFRNKALIPVGLGSNGEVVMGYYAPRSHRIIDFSMIKDEEGCIIGQPINHKILAAIKKYMTEFRIPPYDESTASGLVRHILIRQAMSTSEIMVCIVIAGAKLPYSNELVNAIRAVSPDIVSICINHNTRNDNVIMGDRTGVLWGLEYITDCINVCDKTITFQISANSFYQVNHDQMEKLYSLAVEYANLSGNENVWDLYCGIGTISLSLAPFAGKVYGVEVIPQAIENAKTNALLNRFTNATFLVGEAEKLLPEFYENADKSDVMNHPDVIVVDPPRKGCDEACLSTMVAMSPKKIVYVSCDSATLARDVKYLTNDGYKLKKVRTVDQFGHSMHIETVALLEKC